jgi:UDP-glucose 4-epimerase
MRNLVGYEKDFTIIRNCIAKDYAWREYCKDKDAVIHLAANVSHIKAEIDPYIDVDSNIVGTINLCEGIKGLRSKPKIIYACSRSVYGKTQSMPVTEDHHTNPLDAYGISKLAAEKYLMKYSHHDDIPVISFRMANLVGPRQGLHTRAYQMISWIFRCVSRDETIGFWGDGMQSRDFLYVGDAVDFYKMAIDDKYWEGRPQGHGDNIVAPPLGDFYNLPGGEYSTWLKAIQTCGKVLGKSPKVQFEPYPPIRVKLENEHSQLSGIKLHGRFGQYPRTTLEVAFKKMSEYYPGRWEDYLDEGVL